MADIKFEQDYGYSPASPFFLVWREDGHYPAFKHPNKASAEAEAARIASMRPGEGVHVLGVIATVRTSTDIIGTRFDPHKKNPAPVVDDEPAPIAPEFVDVEGFVTDDSRVAPADDQPF